MFCLQCVTKPHVRSKRLPAWYWTVKLSRQMMATQYLDFTHVLEF